MTKSERQAQTAEQYYAHERRAARELREKYQRPTGQTNTTLALGHVGYHPTGAVDGDEPMTETGRANAEKVQAWRESGSACKPVSLPESGAIGQECGKVSGEAKTSAESGFLAWVVFNPQNEAVACSVDHEVAWMMHFKRLGSWGKDPQIEDDEARGYTCRFVRCISVEAPE